MTLFPLVSMTLQPVGNPTSFSLQLRTGLAIYQSWPRAPDLTSEKEREKKHTHTHSAHLLINSLTQETDGHVESVMGPGECDHRLILAEWTHGDCKFCRNHNLRQSNMAGKSWLWLGRWYKTGGFPSHVTGFWRVTFLGALPTVDSPWSQTELWADHLWHSKCPQTRTDV